MRTGSVRGSAISAFIVLVIASCGRDLTLDLRSAGSSDAAAGTGGSTSAGAGGSDSLEAGAMAGAAGANDGGPGTCLTCASCTKDDDCARLATKKLCNTSTGLCVNCLGDGDCDSSRVCDPVDFQCVTKCTVVGDTACGTQNRTCEPSLQYCVECTTAADCSGDTPVCNHQCVQCVDELSANCRAQSQYCWVQRHACVDCRTPGSSADCAAGLTCTARHTCAP